MKQSGVSWLGEIPENWKVAPLKTAFTRVKRSTVSNAGIVTAFRDGEVTLRSNRRSEGYTEADDYSGYQRIMPADLAIHSMDAFAGAIGVSDSDGICSPVLSVCVAKNGNDPRYMAYQLRLMSKRGWIEALSRSVRERTSEFRWKEAGAQKVALPPIDEQKAIADFLDRELDQIDSLLAKQSEFAKLLNERFEANLKKLVIDFNHLDRKQATGLWEPTLPRTWSTVKLGLVAHVFAGGTPSRDKKEYWEDGTIPWINSGAVNQRFVETPSEFISQQGFDHSSARWIEPGSLVMALAGQGKTKGMVARVGIRTTCNQSMAAITFKDSKVQADFAYWYLFAHYKDIRSLGGSDLRDGLNLDLVSSIKLPVPPINYQAEVSSRLFTEWNRKELLIDRSLKMNDYLNQRKQALISAAVTGKLDIREKN